MIQIGTELIGDLYERIYTSLLIVFLVTAGLSGNALSQDSKALANAVVTATDRSPEDRAMDAGRKPEQLLAFVGVQAGVEDRDLGAGGGYTTELLKRAVGSEGVVLRAELQKVAGDVSRKAPGARGSKSPQ